MVVVGNYDKPVNLGGGTLRRCGARTMFLARFASDGAHRWSRGYGETGDIDGLALAISPSGDLAVAGMFEGTVDFGAGLLRSGRGGTDTDGFVARLAPDGTARWSQRLGGAWVDAAGHVSWEGDDRLVVRAALGIGPVSEAIPFDGRVDVGGQSLVPIVPDTRRAFDERVLELTGDGRVAVVR